MAADQWAWGPASPSEQSRRTGCRVQFLRAYQDKILYNHPSKWKRKYNYQSVATLRKISYSIQISSNLTFLFLYVCKESLYAQQAWISLAYFLFGVTFKIRAQGSEVKWVFSQVVWLRTDGSLFPQTIVWRKLQHHLLCVRVQVIELQCYSIGVRTRGQNNTETST